MVVKQICTVLDNLFDTILGLVAGVGSSACFVLSLFVWVGAQWQHVFVFGVGDFRRPYTFVIQSFSGLGWLVASYRCLGIVPWMAGTIFHWQQFVQRNMSILCFWLVRVSERVADCLQIDIALVKRWLVSAPVLRLQQADVIVHPRHYNLPSSLILMRSMHVFSVWIKGSFTNLLPLGMKYRNLHGALKLSLVGH